MKATYTANDFSFMTTGKEYQIIEKQSEYSYLIDDTGRPIVILNRDLDFCTKNRRKNRYQTRRLSIYEKAVQAVKDRHISQVRHLGYDEYKTCQNAINNTQKEEK